MKQKQLIWLGAALVFLLVIAYVAGVFDSDISTVEVPDVRTPADAVTEIQVDGPGEDIALRKEEGWWRIIEPLEAPADSEAVSRFLEDASALELRSIVSTNPERYARYGADSTGREVTLGWNGEHLTIVIGNSGPTAGTRFVRLEGDEAVYLAGQSIRLPQNVDDWRDKTIVNVSSDAIAAVIVEGPEAAYALNRHDGRWHVESGEEASPADSSEVTRYLQRFSPLRADGFFEAPPAQADTVYVLRMRLDDGGERALRLVPRGDEYATTVDEDATVYRLRGYRFDQIIPDAARFEAELEE